MWVLRKNECFQRGFVSPACRVLYRVLSFPTWTDVTFKFHFDPYNSGRQKQQWQEQMQPLSRAADSPHWSDAVIDWAQTERRFASDWLSWWVQTVRAASAGKAPQSNADKSVCPTTPTGNLQSLTEREAWFLAKWLISESALRNARYNFHNFQLCVLLFPVRTVAVWEFEMGNSVKWVSQWLESLLCATMAFTPQLDNQRHFSKELRLNS